MKKLLPLFCALGFLAHPAFAANNNITTLQNLGQPAFRAFSEDLGSALSYKPVSPTTALGTTGFDIGIEATSTNMAKSSQYWSQITGGSAVNNLVVPKFHIAKGLPLGFDIAAFYSRIPTTNISLAGAELRYAILDGGIATPTVGIRGAFTKLSGVNQLSFDTKSLDLSISKGFLFFTPYAGLGKVWVNSAANITSIAPGYTGLALSEKFSQNKIFVGADLNFGLINFDAEVDKTGAARSISAKVGFRF